MAFNFRPKVDIDLKTVPRTKAKPDLTKKPDVKPEIPPSLENAPVPREAVPEIVEPVTPPRQTRQPKTPVTPLAAKTSRVPQEGWDTKANTMLAQAKVEEKPAEPAPDESMKRLAEMTAPTQIGTPAVPVEPGYVVDQDTGEMIERPDEAEQKEPAAVAPAQVSPSRPLSGLSTKELGELATARAREKHGDKTTRKDINKEATVIAAELRSYKKRDAGKAKAAGETTAKKAAAAQEALAAEDVPIFTEVLAQLKSGKVACFTGHRTDKINAGATGGARYDESTKPVQDVKAGLVKAINLAYKDGYRTFVTGMALGVDQWAAEILIEMKELHPDIVIIGAIPYAGQENAWPVQSSRDRYWDILDAIDGAGAVSSAVTGKDSAAQKRDAAQKLQARNEAMINNSDLVIAIYKGGTGGTANAINYAKAQGKEILHFNPVTGKAQVVNRAEAAEAEVAVEAPAQLGAEFNISSYESGLGAQLTNMTRGKTFPVMFRGETYDSSEAAYQAHSQDIKNDNAALLELMTEVIIAKLEQHPKLVEQINARGGREFLVTATHNLVKKDGTVLKPDDRWVGKDGLFMQALRSAYDIVSEEQVEMAPVVPRQTTAEVMDVDFTRPLAGTVIEAAETEIGGGPPVVATPEQAEAFADAVQRQPDLPPEVEAEVAAEAAEEMFGERPEEAAPPQKPPRPPKGPKKPREPKGPKEPEGPKEPSPIYTKAFKRIMEVRADIIFMLSRGVFQLSGDTPSRPRPEMNKDGTVKKVNGKVVMKEREWVHSARVNTRIREMFKTLGRKYTKSEEKWLFIAFQVYRGFSLDRKSLLFNKDPEKVAINDEQFIKFLDEITANIRTYGHPFAFRSDIPAELGATRAYPLPVTSGLAKFFTKVSSEKGNEITHDEDSFIAFSMNEWSRKDGVRDAIDADVRTGAADYGQRESLLDFLDVIADSWKGDPRGEDTIQPRTINSRLSGDEMFDIMSDYARAVNEESELGLFLKESVTRAEKARAAVEKMSKRLPPPKEKKEKVKGEDIERTSWLKDFAKHPPNHRTVMAALMAATRTTQVAFMPALAGTAVGEHGIQVVDYAIGQKALNEAMKRYDGVEAEATEGSLEIVATPVFLQGVANTLGLMQTRGSQALEDAGYRGVDFTQEVDLEGLEGVREWIMMWTTGDALFKEQVARIFIRNLAYQFARSELLARKARKKDPSSAIPILKVTPEQLEAMMRQSPKAFFRLVATTTQGRRALQYTSSTSLNGVDYLTMGLRRATMNPYADFVLAILGGPFLKYATRSMIFRMPFSVSLMLINKAVADRTRIAAATGLETVGGVVGGKLGEKTEGAVARAEELNTVSDEYQIGAGEDLMDGLGQALIIDLARAPTKLAAIALVGGVVLALGGVQPPDDEDKDHLWYEYTIGGVEFKTAWYWTELLGGTMPLIVAASIAARGDMQKAWQVLGHGLMAEIEEGAWLDVADTLDLFFNWDYHLAEAQARSEGYMGEFEVSESEYGITMISTFLGRRFYKGIEPAVLRSIYNEAGIDSGREKLSHSTNVVFTKDPNDTQEGKLPRTTSTSWSDSQIRKMAYPSYTMGFLLNLFGGYFINNDEEQKTGYLRDQMPYITNADPYQVEMMSDLVVLDENGDEKPYDKWTDYEKRSIGNLVIDWVSSYPPSQLAANGVVLPYEARVSAKNLLDEQWMTIEDEYRDRIEAGEFSSSHNGLDYLENKALQNDAWKAKDGEQKKLGALLDSVWSGDIPYAPTVYNRWETVYRPMYVWKEGTENAGEPTTKMMWRMHRDEIEMTVYPGGEHKSSFLPINVVDDQGQNTYDAQTALAWQTPDTDMDFVRKFAEGNVVNKGMYEGQDLWSIIGAGTNRLGTWDNGRLVMGVRAYVPAEMPHKEIDASLKSLGLGYERADAKAPTTGGQGGWSSGWGSGGGGGSYSPNIYSHPAYSLNPDKPAGLYTKVPSYARFDYLRPSVETKGSREAYRREDF